MMIRPETPPDVPAIRALTGAAFAAAPHASGTEAAIVDALRNAGALALSLVAEDEGGIVGHVAFSAVSISGTGGTWLGLGPVSVLPGRQGSGIGQALIRKGLAQLAASGADGCVVLGDPGYYRRFGFASDPALFYRDVPPPYLQWLGFTRLRPAGAVTFHPAFDVQP